MKQTSEGSARTIMRTQAENAKEISAHSSGVQGLEESLVRIAQAIVTEPLEPGEAFLFYMERPADDS